ncbi:MAG: CxxxxCH/CxxCH domain-containing protein [Methylococcaceae bacterium]|nr:CxxxxCH/CxxCH domain-containing protein [Methylococcaceae bacterium]
MSFACSGLSCHSDGQYRLNRHVFHWIFTVNVN